jgi:hypothetical protein
LVLQSDATVVWRRCDGGLKLQSSLVIRLSQATGADHQRLTVWKDFGEEWLFGALAAGAHGVTSSTG